MSREQVRKLLGGYATRTLTPEERQALFEAALEDQELFDALAREQSLLDLLRDPAAKAQLLAALGEAPATWRRRAARWVWGHAVGLAALACFVTAGGYMLRQAHFTPPRVVVVATEPTTVEVNGSQPPAEPVHPRRIFDLETVKKAVAPPPEMPAPPVLRQRAASVQAMQRDFAVDGITALAVQAPVVPPPAAAPAPGPVAPRPEFAGQPQQGAGVVSAMGGRGGFGGAAGVSRGLTEQTAAAMAGEAQMRQTGGPMASAARTQGVSVTSVAAPVQPQAAGSQVVQLLDASQNALTGRDLFATLTAARPQMAAAGPVGAGKLDPSLVALVQRVHSGARPAAEERRLVSGGQASVRITLTNASADSLAQLRKAGLTITRQQRNELTGRIAVEELEAVTQLAFVVWIAPQ